VLFFLPYLARRRWRLCCGGCVAFGTGQLVNAALVGPTALETYYVHALPAFNRAFVGTVVNVAPYGALLRLVGGASDVSPVVSAPGLAPVLAAILSLGALAVLARLRPAAAPLAGLVALPSVWTNYVALVLPQLVDLWRARERRLPTILAAVAASWVLPVALAMPVFQTTIASTGSGSSAWLALLGAIQPAGLLGLLILSWINEHGAEDLALGTPPSPHTTVNHLAKQRALFATRSD
jgi:hypothetical protein